MMGRALLTVGWVATVGFLASGVQGYLIEPREALGLHLLLGLTSTFLLLFSHSWIMFYLIGTGKALKQAVAEHGLPEEIVEETKRFKNDSYPWLMLAMGLAMATFILAGGVATRVLPVWSHNILFFVTLAVQLKTLVLEHRVLEANRRLMAGVSHDIAGRPAKR